MNAREREKERAASPPRRQLVARTDADGSHSITPLPAAFRREDLLQSNTSLSLETLKFSVQSEVRRPRGGAEGRRARMPIQEGKVVSECTTTESELPLAGMR